MTGPDDPSNLVFLFRAAGPFVSVYLDTTGNLADAPPPALHVFRGAGIVMRCPHCDNALVTIVEDGTRVWIGFAGVRTLQVTV